MFSKLTLNCTLSPLLLTTAIAFADEAPPAPKVGWERSAALGLTLTRGNSDTLSLNGNIQGAKKWAENELKLGADGTYGETDDTKTAESAHGFAQYNRLFTERFYGYARADLLHDAVASLDYRLTLSPGVGYYFIKNDQTKLNAEGGPSFIYQKLGGREKGYIALRLAERFEHKLSDRARIWESVEWLPQIDNFNNYLLNGEIGLEVDINKKFSLRTFVQDNFNNAPAPGRKKNDLKLVTAIAYKF